MKKKLNKLRDDIDKIDTKLLDLISKRAFMLRKLESLKMMVLYIARKRSPSSF